ncbi:MAG: hypothetical protein ACI9VS_000049 [Candidatus Binatia bacterium]|jgi:hypothetical protein
MMEFEFGALFWIFFVVVWLLACLPAIGLLVWYFKKSVSALNRLAMIAGVLQILHVLYFALASSQLTTRQFLMMDIHPYDAIAAYGLNLILPASLVSICGLLWCARKSPSRMNSKPLTRRCQVRISQRVVRSLKKMALV